MSLNWLELGTGALIGAIPSLFVGILANSTSDRLKFWRKKTNNKIEITSPRPGEVFRDSRQLSPGLCYPVAGRLGFLPQHHQIWLLVQNSGTKEIWPQGFADVSYRKDMEQWEGFIFARGSNRQITVVAVVAPPSSQMMFSYYQNHGEQTGWASLEGIPEECKNVDIVRAWLP